MRYLRFIIIITTTIFFSNCEKDAEVQNKDYPYVITNSPTVNSNGAEFSADLINIGNQEILKYGFVWSTESNPTVQDYNKLFDDKANIGTYTYNVNSGLAEGQTYYVRAYILTDQYEVYGNEKSFISQGSLPPEIYDFTPTKGYANTKVLITGKNFGNSTKDIVVKFGDTEANVDSISDTFIQVKSPLIQEDSKVHISVSVAGENTTSEIEYNTFFAWTRMSDYPGLGNHSASYFSLNGKGYLIGGKEYNSNEYTNGPITQNVWEFNSSSNSWVQKSDAPFEAYEYPTCVVNNTGYVYSDFKSCFYKYNDDIDTWEYETSFPGEGYGISCFALDNEIYAGLGIYWGNFTKDCKEFYKYSVDTKTWTELAEFPGETRYKALSFCLNGKGYIALGNDLISGGLYENFLNDVWEYNKELNTWLRKNNFPGEERGMATAFTLKSKAYIGMGTVQYNYNGLPDFWKYDPDLDEWTAVDSYIGNAGWSSIAFTIDEKAYIGSGAKSKGGGSSWTIWRSYKDLWEFNPNKE